ncbi:MAG: cell division protein FtsQ/DivIB [Bacteroidia bacterium]
MKLSLNRRQSLLLLLILLIFGLVFAWTSSNGQSGDRRIKRIEIKNKGNRGFVFFTERDVLQILQKKSGKLTGRSHKSVQLQQLEYELIEQPGIRSADVYVNLNGTLAVKIQEREPLLLVRNQKGEQFYLDSAGILMPTRGKHAEHALPVNGRIKTAFKAGAVTQEQSLKDLVQVALIMAADPFWDAQFEQGYVDNSGRIIMVPRVGTHSIVLGTAENLTQKLENLRLFYEKGLKTMGWNRYRTIDLSYQNQIVGKPLDRESEQFLLRPVQNDTHSTP